KSRCDIRRRDRLEKSLVVANRVGPERLAGIGVDVDAHSSTGLHGFVPAVQGRKTLAIMPERSRKVALVRRDSRDFEVLGSSWPRAVGLDVSSRRALVRHRKHGRAGFSTPADRGGATMAPM